MATFNAVLERHHRPIIFTLAFVVVFFAAACTFHDVLFLRWHLSWFSSRRPARSMMSFQFVTTYSAVIMACTL
jgi:hypothetical protein